MSGNPLLDLAAKERKAVKPLPPADPLDKAFRDLGVKGGLKTVQKARQKEDSLRPNGLGDARRVAQSRLKVDPATHDVVESAMYMNAVDSKGNLIQADTPETDIRKYSVHPLVREAIIKEFKDNPQAATEKYARQREAWREVRTRSLGGAKTPNLVSKNPDPTAGTIPAPLDQEQADAEKLAPDFKGNREHAKDWAQKAARSGWTLPFKSVGELVSKATNPGGIDAVRAGVTHEMEKRIGRHLNEREMRDVEQSVGGYLEQIGNVATSIVTGGATAAGATAGRLLADEALNAYPYAGHALQTLLDPNATPEDRKAAILEGALSSVAGTHVGRSLLGKVVSPVTKPLGNVVQKLLGRDTGALVPETGVQPAQGAEPLIDREAFTKQLQSQEGPLEVGKGAIPGQSRIAEPAIPETAPKVEQPSHPVIPDNFQGVKEPWQMTKAQIDAQGYTQGVSNAKIAARDAILEKFGIVPDVKTYGESHAPQQAFLDFVQENGHRLTLDEWLNTNYTPGGHATLRGAKSAHRFAVEDALAEGKPVPETVLADYPDLVKASTTAEPSTVETPPVEAQVTPEPPQTGAQAVETPPVEPPTPPTVGPAEVPEPPSGTTFKHSEAQTYADEFGADVSKGTRSWDEALAESRKQGIAENALAVAQEAAKRKRPLSDVEKVGLGERLHQIRQQRTDIAQKIADGSASDVEKALYDSLTNDGAKIYDAAFKSGSETGRALNAQKAWIEGPIDDIHLTAKWTSKLGRDLTETESAAVKNLSEKHAELQKSLDDALDRISRLEAEKSVRKNPRAGTSFTRTVTRDQAVSALERLGTVVQPGQLGAGLGGFKVRWNQEDSEALRTVVKYVYEGLAEKGIHTLDAVTENVRKLLPDREIDDVVLHQAIKDALGSEGRTVNRGRTYGEDVLQSGHWALKDPDVSKARAKLEGVRQEADTALMKAIEDEKWRTAQGLNKARLVAKDTLQSMRTVMTTMDDSAIGRQSWLIGLTNPRSWGRGLKNHLRGLTHAGYEAAVEDLRAGSGYELGQQAGLKLRTVVGEEMYGGRMLQKIPGVKQVVNTSERLFDLQSDFAAQDAFDSMVRLTGAGHEEAKVYADFVNALTGKTKFNLGDADPLFFAPKFAWSRFKVLNAPGYIAKAAKAGFKEGGIGQGLKAGSNIAYQYAKAGAMLTGLFAAAQAGGWKVGTDPSSAEFGKIRKGKLVVDLTAGEGAIATLGYRLWNSAVGKPRYFRGSPVSFIDELVTFSRKKLAPAPGALADLAFSSDRERRLKRNNMGEGKDVTGQDVTAVDELKRTTVPLGASQQTQMSKEHPSSSDRFWTALGDFLGYGTSYYAPKSQK